MKEIMEILNNLDWSPLFISIKTGIVATIISFFLGIYAARKVIKAKPWVKAVADGILTLPMVLPPTVAGFFLLLLFSRRRPVGIFLYETFDIKVVQTWLGCIIAATVIAFPLMYRNARAAFEQVDVNLVYAGRTLGMSEMAIFWKVVVPTAGPGIISGTILTFARALGEYGATSMLAGNIPKKTATISQRIAMVVQDGDYMTAGVWVIIVMLIAFGVIVLITDAAAFLAISVPGTVITVLAKGILCGLAAGAVYRLLAAKNRVVAVVAAAVVCPCVNTGVFLLGCLVFFMPTINEWAAASGYASAGAYMILALVGINFLIEMAVNIVLSSAIVQIIKVGKNTVTD